MARILVVDDEEKIRRQIATLLARSEHSVDQAEDAGKALAALDHNMYDLIITDVRLPDHSGLELFREARDKQPHAQVVVITAFGSVEDAVEVIKQGAFDYVQKPFKLEALKLTCEHALADVTLRAEHRYMLEAARAERGGTELVGSSPAMERVRDLIQVAATQPATVLLTGESGTGKELAAEAVHRLSGHHDRPLVKVNCPAIPRDLFESELFGHIKGSFTGAYESKRGKFELADGGTLFLDEISEIPLSLQSKLLRVLEERRFTRVGGNSEIRVNLRIIAATNRDLEDAVDQGRFRQDLYYRLKVFPIHIPPLKARLPDIPELADHLLARVASRYHMPCVGSTRDAVRHLQGYDWPGNVRELRNVLERGLLLARGEAVGIEHLPAELVGDVNRDNPGDYACARGLNERVEHFRREQVLEALKQCRWVKKDAAELLGLSPRAMSHYVSKYDLDRERR